jgi:hypothetical protein
MRDLMMVGVGVIVLVFVAGAFGDVVELPLDCAGFYDVNTPAWTMDFDLGVTFSEITNVYIDWSGEITAGLALYYGEPDPIPFDGSLWAFINSPWHGIAHTMVSGGSSTYPIAPEPFDEQSEFSFSDVHYTWNELLGGIGDISILFPSIKTTSDIFIIYSGSATLNNSTLVIEGTIVPEPSSLFLICIGGLWIIRKSGRKFN